MPYSRRGLSVSSSNEHQDKPDSATQSLFSPRLSRAAGRPLNWFRHSSGCVVLAIVSLWVSPATSQQALTSDLAQGQQLLSHLSLNSADSSADMAIFHELGVARSQQVLLAVVANGQATTATSQDWIAMHRAYDAIIELNIGEQQLFKASIFANLQDAAYRHFEGDYVVALAAARRALDLEQRSGETATLSIPWKNIGDDLLQLGRTDEAATAFYEARKFIQDPTASVAADLWGKIISLESSRGNGAVALSESVAFLQAANPSTPAGFRAGASLASANLEIDQAHYENAISRIHEALSAIKGAPDAILYAYQAIHLLMTLGLQAMQSMPYEQALSFCSRLDKDFPGLPISVSGFAREVGNHRRRLAG